MRKSALVVLLCFAICGAPVAGQENKPQTPKPDAPGPQSPSMGAQRVPRIDDREFVSPADVNVRLESDPRMFVVMAALNMAGFDYEPAGESLSPARVELRKDLAKLDPAVKTKLSVFYKAH